MLFKNRFTIAKLMWIVALAAVVLSSGLSVVSFFVIQLLVITGISEILIRQFPTGIRHAMNANCLRLDGTNSEKRKQIEASQLSKLRMNVIVVLTTICVFSSCVFWLITTESAQHLIEGKQVSLTPMLTYDEPFQDELLTIHDFKIRSEKLAKLSKETEYQEGTRKLTFYTIFFVVWFLAAFLIFQSAYFWMLKRLSKSVYKRAYDYKIRDMGRLMEHS